MGWLQKVLGAIAPDEKVKLDHRAHIGHVVIASGLTKGRREDVDFYVDAYETRRLNPRDVRRFGDLLTNDEKDAAGLPHGLVVAREFVATLNAEGLADPAAAAAKIAEPASHRCFTASALLAMAHEGAALVRFKAAASGEAHCAHAAKVDGARMAIDKAAPLPFDDCSQPELCRCSYRPWQNIADDMGDMMV